MASTLSGLNGCVAVADPTSNNDNIKCLMIFLCQSNHMPCLLA